MVLKKRFRAKQIWGGKIEIIIVCVRVAWNFWHCHGMIAFFREKIVKLAHLTVQFVNFIKGIP